MDGNCDHRGTAEPYIKEGNNAMDWTPLSCHGSRDDEARLQPHALVFIFGNCLRTT